MAIQEQVYIGGPMRGYDQFNFPAFDSLAHWLRKNRKWDVFSPSEHDRETWPDIETWPGFPNGDVANCPKFDLAKALSWDLARVAESQHLVLLPGWEASTGARHERHVAELTGSSIWLASQVLPGHGAFGVGPLDWRLELDMSREGSLQPTPTPVTPHTEIASYGTEIRITNPDTGGAKGSKLARFDLIPAGPLTELAEHYGRGSAKYADRNWERGYDWGLSFAAMMRHAWSFWGGEDIDPDTGGKHIIAVAWHALAQAEFMSTHPELDTRG